MHFIPLLFAVLSITIPGREEKDLYKAKIPESWVQIDSLAPLNDTTLPICSFQKDSILVTIHNFPGIAIPPIAQIERWKSQFKTLDLSSTWTTPQAFGGFCGLYLEAKGVMDGKEVAVLGWSMELDPQLSQYLHPQEKERQIYSCYTIKAKGSPDAIFQAKDEIIAFANSFGLQQEIPIQ